MADAARLNRQAVQILSVRGIGLPANQPTATQANQRTRGSQSDIYALPLDASNWQPLQDTNPASATFGQFYFLPDFSTPGGPDIVM